MTDKQEDGKLRAELWEFKLRTARKPLNDIN